MILDNGEEGKTASDFGLDLPFYLLVKRPVNE